MRFFILRFLSPVLMAALPVIAFSQTRTNTDVLKAAAVKQADKERALRFRVEAMAKEKGWELVIPKINGGMAVLVDIDELGMPIYLSTQNNITAAATIGTNKLWPGGSTGLNLSGSSANLKDKLAIWDEARVLATHVELTGRVVQRDNPGSVSDHSTHVAGTMTAKGINPLAKGMSFNLQELVAYDFNNDGSEMLGEASNLLVSNHSYGAIAGWNYNSSQSRWEFYGQSDANEDYKFGYYSNVAQLWDSIAYNAPYYLILKSAGNNRSVNGPAVGQPYWRYNASNVMASAGNRPAGISNNDSYDIIATNGVAKNILTVGAINPISSGYTKPEDVVMSSFSSWGPTDDGRIKPDVVADGVNLLSSVGTSNNAYDILSGTSMATPNAAGSLLLLQEYYSSLHSGTFMRSATLKGIAIHTADEAGTNPGPDYQFGWGLLNMQKAAAVIGSNNTKHLIQENTLANGGTLTVPVIASGTGPLSATISWTDPKATPVSVANALNNTDKRLVNDLDMVIKKGATTYRPWVLTPSVPSAPASTGDNTLDNVEKVEVADVIPGDAYTIQVSHKGTLERGQQAYSLIVSGVGGVAYCASGASSNAGARVDSVSFSNVQKKNAAGCTTYTNNLSITGNLQTGQTLPLFIRLNSCDATNVDKIVKVFLDANNDGDFTDGNELLATSNVINGNGDYTTNITIPSGIAVGTYSILRIVVQETNSAAAVTSCGTYTRGETQDYRVLFVNPAIDFSISEIVAPASGTCGTLQQYVSVAIRNNGTADKKDIGVTAVVKQGATTIATLTTVYADTVYAGTSEVYTFQTPVALLPNTAYTITAGILFTGDQDPSNNSITGSFTTGAKPADPAGTAIVCGTSAQLNATAVTGTELFNWYTSVAATTPIATGATATTATIQPTYYLSANETGKLGPANKQVFTDGGYNVFVNNAIKVTTTAPVTIETARLYIGTSGKITFLVRQIVTENADGSYTYFPVSSKTVDVYATALTPPVLGAQVNDPSDAGAIYRLDLDFPTANNYYIVIQCANGASIFRNNNVTANPYPSAVPGVISITGNSATLAGDPNYFQKFWYFLYDMNLKLRACPSGRSTITATTVTAPVISITGNVLSSNIASGNQWYLNGNPISGATAQTYTATESGNYTSQITTGSCTVTSNQIAFVATPVTNVDPVAIGMTTTPNPAPGGQFTIQLETRTKSDLQIVLSNTVGQKVYQSTIPDFTGRLSKLITPNKLAPGIYYLQVTHDKKQYVKKIIVVE